MKRVRKTVYLTEDADIWQESLRQVLEEEHLLFSSGMSDAGWMRIVIQAGLESLTQQARQVQEA